MNQRILIIGANSAIAQAIARRYAAQQADLFLVARNAEQLETVAADLTIRGARQVFTRSWDAQATDQQSVLLQDAYVCLERFDGVIIAYGSLTDQAKSEQDVALTLQDLHINALSVIALLTMIANQMQAQGSGTIAVISSVAGDRGRQSNYVYGAAKAAVTTFLQGLRARMFKHGVHVLTIKPGFVATPMTAHLKKNALFVSPERVAQDVMQAIARKRNSIYTPGFWLGIMWVVRHLPESIAKRLSF